MHVDLDVAAHIPPHYIHAERTRIEVYRRIAACRTVADLEQLECDLADAFGPFPRPVSRLLELAVLRVDARKFGISSISLSPPDVIFRVDHLPSAEPLFTDVPGSVRMPDPKTVHMRLPSGYFEPMTLLPILRQIFTKAASKVETAP